MRGSPLLADQHEVDASEAREAALAVGDVRHMIAAEIRVKVNHLDGPDPHLPGYRYIQSTAMRQNVIALLCNDIVSFFWPEVITLRTVVRSLPSRPPPVDSVLQV